MDFKRQECAAIRFCWNLWFSCSTGPRKFHSTSRLCDFTTGSILNHDVCILESNMRSMYTTRWWFQTFVIFTPIWGRFPIWLIFFRWVETTNQTKILPSELDLNIEPYGICFLEDEWVGTSPTKKRSNFPRLGRLDGRNGWSTHPPGPRTPPPEIQ